MRRSPLGWIGAIAATAIVVASIVVRLGGPADPAADVSQQREAVTRFHDLLRAGRWDDVYRSTTEPPAKSAAAFAALMRDQVKRNGNVRDVEIEEMRLLRSRTTPLLEVRETVTISDGGRTSALATVSYFARQHDRWLFAFSAPDERRD
jgi:hypothetical protein